MIVENKTVLDGNKICKDLVEKSKKSFIPKWITIGLLFILTILLTITAFLDEKYTNLFVSAIFLFFDGYYFINGIKVYKSIPKKVKEDNKNFIDNTITYHYKLKEQSFIVFAIVDHFNRRLEYKYDDIIKVYEYHNRYEFKLKDNTYLYINKDSYITEKGDEFFKKTLKQNKVKLKYIK